jgi:hypothetical protein
MEDDVERSRGRGLVRWARGIGCVEHLLEASAQRRCARRGGTQEDEAEVMRPDVAVLVAQEEVARRNGLEGADQRIGDDAVV